MLQYKINHIYGSQENHDLELIKLELDTTNLDEGVALENGWLIDNDKWYQCRSVRIDCSLFKPVGKTPPSITTEHCFEYNSQLSEIYKQYCSYKNFKEYHDILNDHQRASWLIIKDNNIPVAFTKFIHYKQGIESQFSAWNYHNPKMSLGKKLVNFEVAVAKSTNLQYLYIGQGYEKGSIYKSEYSGFEWWTGSEWSKDKQKYRQLCMRDSSINTLDDLSKVFND